jgi:hypothetical protein
VLAQRERSAGHRGQHRGNALGLTQMLGEPCATGTDDDSRPPRRHSTAVPPNELIATRIRAAVHSSASASSTAMIEATVVSFR